ncbi:MAG: helix-turn-helix domain-containing protein [Alphaproteobacteria bacterium]|nr:helix-turn-helix domain-containing protein [Alphaproteobacteria bacterium]
MTPRDAAVYIGGKINTLAVWRMTNKYDLPFVKLGWVIRYRKTDLDEWINKNVSTDRAE